MDGEAMATELDEEMLLRIWNRKDLGEYEGRWIAFREGRILASQEYLSALSERFLDEIRDENGPLFAFVTFGAHA
jgi:hypothetical protein